MHGILCFVDVFAIIVGMRSLDRASRMYAAAPELGVLEEATVSLTRFVQLREKKYEQGVVARTEWQSLRSRRRYARRLMRAAPDAVPPTPPRRNQPLDASRASAGSFWEHVGPTELVEKEVGERPRVVHSQEPQAEMAHILSIPPALAILKDFCPRHGSS